MSKKKHMGLRFTSAALCLSILAAGVAANWTPVKDIPVSAKTLAELQEERKSNEAKIAEKQKQLDSLGLQCLLPGHDLLRRLGHAIGDQGVVQVGQH